MIRDTAQAFLAEVSSSNAIRSAMDTEQGFDPQIWQRICEEMYWQAIHIPEEYGGMGLGYVDLVVMLEQMGRYLLCSPFFSTVCLASNALIVAGTDEQKQQYLTQICEGSLTATLAYTSKNGQWDATAVQGIVTAQGDDYVLNGTYRYVLDGHTAQLLIVAARSEGSEGEQGISLFAIDSDTPGVKRTWLPTMDQTRKQAEIVFDNVRVSSSQLMGEENNAWSQLNKVLQLAAIAIAAEQVGGSQQVLDLTVEYTKERVQFGRPIAGFQAVKHQAADMMLRTEVARSAVYYAACVAQEALSGGLLADELGEAASVAKSYCSEGYFKNAGDALQLHGGVGFTWEYDVHLYFKRAKSSELFLGDAAYHREHVATLLLD
ncbi:putative acyl-CoA dehydrogenase family protein [Pseudoalteromonas translucida]|uniref:Acyl-CoA dehydrogenase family protein n=2 Tax=Pseudoalteromonas translucida TaxID=166935 RepID=Q3IEP7_PSET1|nr:putative acyl-CoA dehydrogenase family protein [Pseudoalteromonas translucida]